MTPSLGKPSPGLLPTRLHAWARQLGGLLRGVGLVAVIALVARLITLVVPAGISEITIGVLLGLLVATLIKVPEASRPGIRFSVRILLRLGIVLLGAHLSFSAVMHVGAGALVTILLCAVFALGLVFLLATSFHLPVRLGTLLAVGTAICGNSAVVATAPAIEASEEEVSFAVATITLFGVAAVLVYPMIGHLLGMSDASFGRWAGVAVNDTSQVTAAGFAYSSAAGDVATIVKLTRNVLIGPVVAGIGVIYQRIHARRSGDAGRRLGAVQVVPLFVVGFLGMAVLNSFGLVPTPIGSLFSDVSKGLILMALVGVGLSTDLGRMRIIGLTPLYVGLAGAAGLSLFGFVLVAVLK